MHENFVITKIERVAMVGKEEYPQKHITFGTNIPCNELIFHYSGESTVLFDEVVLHTKANSIRFLPKRKVSQYEVFHEPGDCILVDFQTDLPVSKNAFTTYSAQNEHLGALFRKMFLCWSAKKEGYYFECLSMLYSILAQMMKHDYLPINRKERIEPALQVIARDHLTKSIPIEELAILCDMSVSYLKQIFYATYGVSPKKYIIGLKMNHACSLLRAGQLSVQQVAEACNYSCVSFFSRQFTQYIGISPTGFQKKYISSK